MTIDEIRKFTDVELANKIVELKSNLLALRFQARSGQLENGKLITQCRKDVAKCLTVVSERKANKAGAEVK